MHLIFRESESSFEFSDRFVHKFGGSGYNNVINVYDDKADEFPVFVEDEASGATSFCPPILMSSVDNSSYHFRAASFKP